MKRLMILLLALLLALPVHAEDVDFEGEPIAAAYVGYGADIGSVLRSEDAAALLAAYPFMADIPARNTVVMPGCEVYCIVPAPGTVIVVEGLDTAAESYPAVYTALWTGSEPVLVIGNESDIMPNLQIRVLTEAGESLFTPCMSLRDGSFIAHGAGDGTADLTVYPEGFVFEED